MIRPSRTSNVIEITAITITLCSVDSFNKKLQLYLSIVPDVPCQPGFNISLDHRDCLRWWTSHNGLAHN